MTDTTETPTLPTYGVLIEQLEKSIGRLNEQQDNLEAERDDIGDTFRIMHNKIDATDKRFELLAKDFRDIVDGLHAQDDGDSITRARVTALEDLLQAPKHDNVEIYKALIAAQSEIRNADKLTDNEFTHKKYADLASVMDAVRQPLANNGLAVFQVTATIEEVLTVDRRPDAIGIKTTLIHESGQTIVDIIAMTPPKSDPQGVGSARTYMRRYAILALFAISGADDDDAEGTKKDPKDYPRITTAEAESILMKADELFGKRAETALTKMLKVLFGGLTNIGDIKEGEYEVAITNLENSKKLMDATADLAKKTEAAEKKAADAKKKEDAK